jgi:choline dehydrogenase
MNARTGGAASVAPARNYDYIVVGGGTAGIVVASRLAESPDVRVALIEAGRTNRSPIFGIPGAASRVAFDPRNAWGFMTEPQHELNGRNQSLVQARILGGGSTINGMVYTRGSVQDYAEWERLGAKGWSYTDVLPWFRRSQRSDRAGSQWHGTDGPLTTRRAISPLGIAHRMRDALGEAGFPIIDDLNIPEPDGFGWNDWAIDAGRRASSATAFSAGRGGLSNVDLFTDSHALGLVVEGHRVLGVRIAHKGNVTVLHAEQQVVLSAGAIGTPRLLLLSGIGPADELKTIGIKPVADLSQVGRNLRNHIAYALTYRSSAPISARRYWRLDRRASYAAKGCSGWKTDVRSNS